MRLMPVRAALRALMPLPISILILSVPTSVAVAQTVAPELAIPAPPAKSEFNTFTAAEVPPRAIGTIDDAVNRAFYDAIGQAVHDHPTLRVSAAHVSQAGEGAEAARAALYPQVDASLDGGPHVSNRSTTNGNNVEIAKQTGTSINGVLTVSQLLFDWGAAFSRIASADASFEAAKIQKVVDANTFILDAVTAYLNVYRTYYLVAQARENITRHEKFLAQTEVRVKAGMNSISDQLRAQSRLADARSMLTRQEAARREALARKVELFGQAAITTAPPTLTPPTPSETDNFVNQQLARNPQIRRQNFLLDAAGQDYDAVRAENLPRLTLEASGTKYDLAKSTMIYDLSAGVKVRYNLFSGGASAARERTSLSRKAQAQAELDTLRREIERQIKARLSDLQARRERVLSLDLGRRASEGTVVAYQDQFLIKHRTLLDLLDAQRDAYQQANDYINETYDTMISSYTLLGLNDQLLDFFNLGSEIN